MSEDRCFVSRPLSPGRREKMAKWKYCPYDGIPWYRCAKRMSWGGVDACTCGLCPVIQCTRNKVAEICLLTLRPPTERRKLAPEETEESSRRVYMRAPTKRKPVPEQDTAPCGCDACRVEQADAVPDCPDLSSLSADDFCHIIKSAWDGEEDLRFDISAFAVSLIE